MKIPQQIHQFSDEHALIVVAGKNDALMYDARSGEILLVDSLRITWPHQQENEGHFKARSQGGGAIRSGVLKEIRDQEIVSEFIRELKDHLARVRAEVYTDVYVTAPAKTKNVIVKALPSGLKDKLRTVIDGNYNHTNPLRVIDMVVPSQRETPPPKSEEAQKILNKTQTTKADF